MRSEERFALEALNRTFGGTYIEGEDPPDAYFINDELKIGVEVSFLVEEVEMETEAAVSKISQYVDDKIGDMIPEDRWIYLGLRSPINRLSDFKRELLVSIQKLIENDTHAENLDIVGNKVSIFYYRNRLKTKDRVLQFHSYQSKFSIEQARQLLESRISKKSELLTRIAHSSTLWLVLINLYRHASTDLYKEIYKNLKIDHPFEKIIIVNEHGRVETLNQ